MEKENEKAWASMSLSNQDSQEQKESTEKETQKKESEKSNYEKVTHRKSTDRAVSMDVDVETMQEKEARENEIAAA